MQTVCNPLYSQTTVVVSANRRFKEGFLNSRKIGLHWYSVYGKNHLAAEFLSHDHLSDTRVIESGLSTARSFLSNRSGQLHQDYIIQIWKSCCVTRTSA